MEPDFSSEDNRITIDDYLPLDDIVVLDLTFEGSNLASSVAVTGGPVVTSLHNEIAFQPAEIPVLSSEELMSHTTSRGASRAVGVRPSFGIRHSRMAECCAQILDWLEKPKNLARWAGLKDRSRKEGKKDTRVKVSRVRPRGGGLQHGSEKDTKIAVFREILTSFHKHRFLPEVRTGEHLQRRYNHYVMTYTRVLGWKNDSIFGLTEAERKKGWTIQAKFEKTCPHFERMHSLFEQMAEMGRAREGSV